MNDDLTDDQFQLVSAYVDGAATPDERARVEADPTLQAGVEAMRGIRAALADTPPPPISVRERHLAAALDAWDNLPQSDASGEAPIPAPATADDVATAAITAPSPLAPRRDRRGSQRSPWLLSAAAALVVIAGGAVVVGGVLSDDATDDTAADTAAVENASPSAANAESAEEPAEEAADDSEDTSLAAREEADLPSDDLRVTPQIGEALADSGENRPGDTFERIDTAAELAAYARAQVELEESIDSGATRSDGELESAELSDAPAGDQAADGDASATTAFDPLCDGLVDRIIGDIEFGEGLYPIPAAVGLDESTDEVIAYRVDTCDVVARAPLGR